MFSIFHKGRINKEALAQLTESGKVRTKAELDRRMSQYDERQKENLARYTKERMNFAHSVIRDIPKMIEGLAKEGLDELRIPNFIGYRDADYTLSGRWYGIDDLKDKVYSKELYGGQRLPIEFEIVWKYLESIGFEPYLDAKVIKRAGEPEFTKYTLCVKWGSAQGTPT